MALAPLRRLPAEGRSRSWVGTASSSSSSSTPSSALRCCRRRRGLASTEADLPRCNLPCCGLWQAEAGGGAPPALPADWRRRAAGEVTAAGAPPARFWMSFCIEWAQRGSEILYASMVWPQRCSLIAQHAITHAAFGAGTGPPRSPTSVPLGICHSRWEHAGTWSSPGGECAGTAGDHVFACMEYRCSVGGWERALPPYKSPP